MAKTINHDLSPEDLAWLKRLSDEIWQINPSPGNIHGDAYWTEKRRLSKAEWNLLKRIVSSCELPCLPGGGTFGLGFSLTVCNHTPLPQIKPTPLIIITDNHLPGIRTGHGGWDQAWDAFSPLTHSQRNIEILAFYGLQEPRGREHYEY